ncbi:MAG: hypothetical protein ONB13_13090, partial [candidate division KSB1 bacterium]|nr:hypothetical protein [candidate division KSB1 bacterium]
FDEPDLLRLIQIASDAQNAIKRSANPRLFLEMIVTKMIQLDKVQKIDSLIEGIDVLKAKVLQGPSINTIATGQDAALPPNTMLSDQKKSPQPQAQVVRDASLVTMTPATNQAKSTPAADTNGSSNRAATPVIGIEMVKDRWGMIIEEIKKRKIALGSFLNEGLPDRIEGNELVVVFGMENSFHIHSIHRNRKEIELILAELLHVPLRIRCVQAEGPNVTPGSGNGNSYIDKLGQKIPLIKTIIEEFDGELVR